MCVCVMFVISQVGETERVAKEIFYWNVTAGLLPGAHIRDAVLGVRERGGGCYVGRMVSSFEYV